MTKKVNIDTIKIGDRIRRSFGNIEELAADIEKNGLINPPTVTPDMRLLAGERRIRAMKYLGWSEVEVRVMEPEDAEHELRLEIAENDERKQFSKSEIIEGAKKLERIVAAKAEQRMKAGKAQDDPMETFPQGRATRDIVAEEMGIGSGKQYEKEKFIYDNRDQLTPEEFEKWDKGEYSDNKMYQKIKAEQKAAEERAERAESDNEKLRNELERVIDENRKQVEKNQELQDKLDAVREDAAREDINDELEQDCIFFCARCDSFLKAVGGYAYLADKLNRLTETKRKEYEIAINAMGAWMQNIMFAMREQKREPRQSADTFITKKIFPDLSQQGEAENYESNDYDSVDL